MKLTNFHTHTILSDGSETAENMVIAAIDKKFDVLGFSEHSPIPFYSDWNMKFENLCKYFDEIKSVKEKYSDKIEIYTGLEVDYIENICGIDTWKNYNPDYTIGSVHYLRQFDNNEFFTLDYSKELFQKGLEEIFGNDIKKLVKEYYSAISKMVTIQKPEIVGHLNLITKFNKGNYFFDESEKWYKDIVAETLEVISKNNVIIEINTRGFYRKLTDEFYPSHSILEQCFKLKIPVMINSDAHQSSELDKNIAEAKKTLLETGFKDVAVLIKNKWQKTEL